MLTHDSTGLVLRFGDFQEGKRGKRNRDSKIINRRMVCGFNTSFRER
jgi:hypothetical protein